MPAFPPACNCPAPISAVRSKNYAAPSQEHLLPELGTYLPSPNYQIQEAQYYSLPSSSSLISDRLTGNAPYGDSPNSAEAFRGGYGFYDPNAPTLAGFSERQGRTKPSFVNPSTGIQHDKSACRVIGGGYACCSLDLEATMTTAYKQLSKQPNFNSCNTGLIAKVIQKRAEKKFGMSFETIVALQDFAAKTAYQGNLTCKFEYDGKYFYSYPTPFQNGIEQRVMEQRLSRFSNANRTKDARRTPGEDRVNQKEKQRLSDRSGRSGPTGERTVRSISDLSSANYIKFDTVNSTTTGRSP